MSTRDDHGRGTESRHVSEWIDRPASDVYEYVFDPAHLPEWAPGLCSAVENVDGTWFVVSGADRLRFDFAERNAFGVLDHDVTMPSGEVVHNPMRVIPDGDACEVTFAVRRQPGMTRRRARPRRGPRPGRPHPAEAPARGRRVAAGADPQRRAV